VLSARTQQGEIMRRKLIKGSAIVSMDAAIGDLPKGDVLI
jgi:hypothetical protein